MGEEGVMTYRERSVVEEGIRRIGDGDGLLGVKQQFWF